MVMMVVVACMSNSMMTALQLLMTAGVGHAGCVVAVAVHSAPLHGHVAEPLRGHEAECWAAVASLVTVHLTAVIVKGRPRSSHGHHSQAAAEVSVLVSALNIGRD